MTTNHKLCPRCQAAVPLAALYCTQCGHAYRTQFAPPASSASSSPRSACLYCGAPLTGPFCSQCGHAVYPQSVRHSTLDLETLDAAQARAKSYVGAALVVFILYWCFWIPGFVANLMFINEAEEMERRAGISLPGAGALRFMFGLNLALIAVGVVLIVIAVGQHAGNS